MRSFGLFYEEAKVKVKVIRLLNLTLNLLTQIYIENRGSNGGHV